MSEAILLSGLAIVGAMLLVLFLALRDTDLGGQKALQIILIAFLLGIIVMIGKVGVESYDHCSWLVSNSTTSGNSTSYGYTWTCEPNTNSTASTFYQSTVWVMRLVSAYLVIAFAFEAIEYFGGKKKDKLEGKNNGEN